jgi:hypothetical protein
MTFDGILNNSQILENLKYNQFISVKYVREQFSILSVVKVVKTNSCKVSILQNMMFAL